MKCGGPWTIRKSAIRPPVIFTINGKRHLVVWHPNSITGLDPETGKQLWDVPYSVRVGTGDRHAAERR